MCECVCACACVYIVCSRVMALVDGCAGARRSISRAHRRFACVCVPGRAHSASPSVDYRTLIRKTCLHKFPSFISKRLRLLR